MFAVRKIVFSPLYTFPFSLATMRWIWMLAGERKNDVNLLSTAIYTWFLLAKSVYAKVRQKQTKKKENKRKTIKSEQKEVIILSETIWILPIYSNTVYAHFIISINKNMENKRVENKQKSWCVRQQHHKISTNIMYHSTTGFWILGGYVGTGIFIFDHMKQIFRATHF